ncbi:hypothetical protein BC8716_16555 [Shouchella clausii]|uniref:YlqD protein n=1 Tax=Shouchella clausii TaxID=79880 RepID=A0A268P3C5_SHOCL|nr:MULTISPECIES: YlqD family protein [Shouchella]AST97479.1 hypothetical protein BC8716_16555 [Shouchella clausii]MCZ1180406.1 hypothetical protein [Shouchella clausii]PAD19324.1 hypothetical protein CHH73_01500 [Shouchella clausii]PAD48340.1 hypothetical protein CHI09_03140 [Shouchella clausii]PAE85339.1 hypothetical protein CHH77_01125 [Shouchella clausii]
MYETKNGGLYVKCIRTATVKHVLTESKKADLKKSFERDLTQIETELSQMEFQLQRALKPMKHTTAHGELQQKYRKEIKRREERMASLTFRIEQLMNLPIGTELAMGTTEIILDVKEGDKWIDEETELTIVVNDGYIAEIREGGASNDELV